MRRLGFSAAIAIGALWLAVISFARAQYAIGIVFLVLAVLRGVTILRARKPSAAPAVRLNIAEPAELKYPKLPADLKTQLDAITPGIDGDLKYYPCAVRLHDGSEVDRVYLVSEAPYLKHWGVYPGLDSGKREIPLQDVVSAAESPSRIPSRFANELYRAGESGMGYTLFTVTFTDGSTQAYVAGNAVDFIEYPEGKGQRDISAIEPHAGRNDPNQRTAPDYWWCIFSE